MDWWVVLEIFLGAGLASGFVILVEKSRKPKINLEKPEIVPGTYEDGTRAKTARLSVTNEMLRKCKRWINRHAAINCYGYIDFYDTKMKKYFKERMPIKWAYEPGLERLPTGYLIRRFRDVSFLDIQPGEEQLIDVAVRYNDDKPCYGWCYENYFSSPQYRNKKWEISEGEYVVRVEIRFGGNIHTDYFRLYNKETFGFTEICKKDERKYRKILK